MFRSTSKKVYTYKQKQYTVINSLSNLRFLSVQCELFSCSQAFSCNVCIKKLKKIWREKKNVLCARYYACTVRDKTNIYKIHLQPGSVCMCVWRKKHNPFRIYCNFARKFYWQEYPRNYMEEDNHECKYERIENIKSRCLCFREYNPFFLGGGYNSCIALRTHGI